MSYTVHRLTGRYRDRQLEANRLGCICYVEHHFNALEYDKPGDEDNPALALVADNASDKTIAWAEDYTARIHEKFGNEDRGVLFRSNGQAGYWNLYYTAMPAILVEPLFISEPQQSRKVRSEAGQNMLATALVRSILDQFPEGGPVAFSCGHLGNREGDLGAPARNKSGNVAGWEALLANLVLDKAQVLLESLPAPADEPVVTLDDEGDDDAS